MAELEMLFDRHKQLHTTATQTEGSTAPPAFYTSSESCALIVPADVRN